MRPPPPPPLHMATHSGCQSLALQYGLSPTGRSDSAVMTLSINSYTPGAQIRMSFAERSVLNRQTRGPSMLDPAHTTISPFEGGTLMSLVLPVAAVVHPPVLEDGVEVRGARANDRRSGMITLDLARAVGGMPHLPTIECLLPVDVAAKSEFPAPPPPPHPPPPPPPAACNDGVAYQVSAKYASLHCGRGGVDRSTGSVSVCPTILRFEATLRLLKWRTGERLFIDFGQCQLLAVNLIAMTERSSQGSSELLEASKHVELLDMVANGDLGYTATLGAEGHQQQAVPPAQQARIAAQRLREEAQHERHESSLGLHNGHPTKIGILLQAPPSGDESWIAVERRGVDRPNEIGFKITMDPNTCPAGLHELPRIECPTLVPRPPPRPAMLLVPPPPPSAPPDRACDLAVSYSMSAHRITDNDPAAAYRGTATLRVGRWRSGAKITVEYAGCTASAALLPCTLPEGQACPQVGALGCDGQGACTFELGASPTALPSAAVGAGSSDAGAMNTAGADSSRFARSPLAGGLEEFVGQSFVFTVRLAAFAMAVDAASMLTGEHQRIPSPSKVGQQCTARDSIPRIRCENFAPSPPPPPPSPPVPWIPPSPPMSPDMPTHPPMPPELPSPVSPSPHPCLAPDSVPTWWPLTASRAERTWRALGTRPSSGSRWSFAPGSRRSCLRSASPRAGMCSGPARLQMSSLDRRSVSRWWRSIPSTAY